MRPYQPTLQERYEECRRKRWKEDKLANELYRNIILADQQPPITPPPTQEDFGKIESYLTGAAVGRDPSKKKKRGGFDNRRGAGRGRRGAGRGAYDDEGNSLADHIFRANPMVRDPLFQ